MMFQNREEAGRQLAAKLQAYREQPEGVILALPRGGVAVGYEVSVALHLPLDVFITRKIGAPGNPEYALGAVSEGGNIYMNPEAMAAFRLAVDDLQELAAVQRQEIARRQTLYRQGRHPLPLKDRVVIVVDDGIATGATFFASVEAIRQQSPARLIAAIPVGPPDTIRKARAAVDELVVLATPEPFWAVGSHYVHFEQVEDREVLEYLNLADESLRERATRAPSSRV
ncbi:MAG: phosphoribosyltransferase [Nitrospira sp.]|jgi:putative phosphoribosyl transferase|nr:phosphoribosyltransferase [Nitrospira sp.]